MVEVLGQKVPVTSKVLHTSSSPIILDYINAIKAGESQANKVFRKISV